MSRILLIDLSSVFYPCWHVRDGKDTNFPYQATIERVRNLAAQHEHVAVCCDSGRSFRKDIAADYKANRPDKDAALIDQLRRVEETLERDGLFVCRAPSFEADDLIATMVRWAREQKQEALVASSDKDLLALVGHGVTAYSLTKSVELKEADVVAKLGVKPSQVRDFLALVGDKSDNVAGIKGVGDKRAAELLSQFGSISGIYAALNQTPDKVSTPTIRQALIDGVKTLDTAIKLVTLRDDAPIDCAKVLEPRVAKPLAQVNDAEFYEEENDNVETVNPQTGEVSTVTQLPAPVAAPTPTPTPTPAANYKPQNTSTSMQKTIVEEVAPGEWAMALEPRNPGQLVALSARLFNSRMFAGYGNEDAVLSTIMLGRELGIGAMGSLRGIHNIRGKHALSADLMAALILQSGKAKFFEAVNLSATSATYRTHRIGSNDPFEMTFDFEEARIAGLVKEDSGWLKWPLDMCKARVIARLARTVYPDICFGLYVPEELESLKEAA